MSLLPEPQRLYRPAVPVAPALSSRPPRHRPGQRFLKGPIPLHWLQAAARLPGQACQVGLALWYLAGLGSTATVSLSNAVLTGFGVDRHAKYRALKALAGAGLITVTRSPGQNPVVTIREIDPS